MTEKELEKLFQEKLKNREVAFNPASWEKMKPLLADVKPAAAWWQTRRAAIFAGLIGLSSLAYFGTTYMDSEQPTEKAMPALTVASPESSTSNPSTGATHQNSSSSSASEQIAFEDALVEDAIIEESLPEDQNKAGYSYPVANEHLTSSEEGIATREPSSSEMTENPNPTPEALEKISKGHKDPTEQEVVLASVNSENSPVTAEELESVDPRVTHSNVSEPAATAALANQQPKAVDPQRVLAENSPDAPSKEKSTSGNVASLDSPEEEIIINRAGSQRSLSELHEVILTTGTNASFPYASSLSESNSPAFSYLAGIEYRYYSSPKYSIRTGLTLANHANVNCIRVGSEKVYDFGSTTVTEHVKTKNFQFLEIPLTLGIQIAPNLSLFAGGYASAMVNMENEITTVTETPIDLFHSVSNESGHTNAYSNWDTGIKAGVTYRITNRFLLGAEGTFGLIDQTKDEYFNESSFDRNIQAKFYIGYKLF